MNKSLLVCDLDNTLYDWVAYFVPAFYAMLDVAVEILGCDREALLNDFRTVHQRHHDSEHPFALLELETVKATYSGCSQSEIARILDPALHAFNSVRKEILRLYPGVKQTLEHLQGAGLTLVAHTESKLFAVMDRMTRLQLSDYFDRVYCRERSTSTHPSGHAAELLLDYFPMEKVVELSRHQKKPDPDVLLEICRHQGAQPADVAYVGDSLSRDMLMARSAGITSIWAKYGTRHRPGDYERLVRVTHWTAEDVAREVELRERAAELKPDYVLESGFHEIRDSLGASDRKARKRASA